MTVFSCSGYTLRCYHCTNSGPTPDVKCNGTIKNCTSDELHCNVYSTRGSNFLYAYTRDCVAAEVCQPNFCKDAEESYGQTNCSVACCQGDLCNRDVIRNQQEKPVNSTSCQPTISLIHAIQIGLMTVLFAVY
jgi:hypothetical protein